MLDHLGLQCADVEAAATFYLRVLEPVGLREAMRFTRDEELVLGLAGPEGKPDLWLGPLAEGGENRPVHLALVAPSREAVDAVHAAALEAGTEVLHAPRTWPEYHPGYYAVFLRDPDGNNVEAVHHTW